MNSEELPTSAPQISVIIPFRNASAFLDNCLEALVHTQYADYELILVDDGSTDRSADIARRFSRHNLSLRDSRGPAFARNRGAEHAKGEILFFIDSDVLCHPETLSLVHRLFADDPGIDAVIGSYDSAPPARNFLSRYKNLTHHFVHQNGSVEASSFWTGCGAVRRVVFLDLGGFDETYRRPSIEDIEFGYRLRSSGHRIALCKQLQVGHAKVWTLKGLLRSDIFDRAIPWTRLQLQYGRLFNDLNTTAGQRAAAALCWIALFSLFCAFLHPLLLPVAAISLLLVIFLNRRLYSFYYEQGGFWFCIGAMGMHFLYYIYSLMAFFLGCVSFIFARGKGPKSVSHARR